MITRKEGWQLASNFCGSFWNYCKRVKIVIRAWGNIQGMEVLSSYCITKHSSSVHTMYSPKKRHWFQRWRATCVY